MSPTAEILAQNGPHHSNGHAPNLQVLATPDIIQKRAFAVATLALKPDGKLDKAPRTPRTLEHAETNDIDTLGTYADAVEAIKAKRARACGPVLKRDGIICIDLDGAFNPDTGELTEGAAKVLSRFPGALVTISASGRGLHIWIKAKAPFSDACKDVYLDGQKIEILAEKFIVEFWKPFGETGEILPFNDELKTLYNELKPVQTPNLTPMPHGASNGSANGLNGHTNGANIHPYISKALENARAEIMAAPDGTKHNLRIKWARTLGGWHWLGLSEQTIIETLSLNITGDARNAHKAIADGIEYGKAAPREIPPLPPRINGYQSPQPYPNGHHNQGADVQVLAADGHELRPRYETFTLAQMAAFPRPQWLIRGLLVEATTSNVTSDSGHFKTFVVLEMALCLAAGIPCYGREVRQGAVVYVAAEGFWTIHERAAAWAQVRGVDLPENFHVLKVPVNVSDPAVVEAFAQTVAEFSPSLVVLDTLSQNATGLNENANNEMALFMGGMMALANRLNAHVMAVHHNAKATGTFRGAGAIKNNVDTHITLDRPDMEQNVVFVRCEKQRGRPFEAFALTGDEITLPFTDEFGEAVTSLVFEPCGEVAPKVAKHPSTTRADKTRDALLEVFDRVAREAEEKGFEGVKVGFWKEAATESDTPVCSAATFWAYRKKLEGKEIEECGTHNNSPIFRRIKSTPSTPSTPNETTNSDTNSAKANDSKYSNNPLGVGVLGVPIADGAKQSKASTKKAKANTNSEAYQAPSEADETEVF